MDPFDLIFYLIVLSLLALTFVMPIAALVLAITTRRRLNREIARLRSSLLSEAAQQISPARPDTTGTAIQQLEARIEQIEATLGLVRVATTQPVAPAEPPQPLPPTPIPPAFPSPQIDALPLTPREPVTTRTP